MSDDTEDRPVFAPKDIPEHESGVRRLIGDATGEPYEAFRSLAEAQAAPEGVVIFEGDYGGQIYVVARAAHVRCSERVLHDLLADLDAHGWEDPDGARVFYEQHPAGAGIAGGMGGGVVVDGVWVHPRLHPLAAEIAEVLAAQRARISPPAG